MKWRLWGPNPELVKLEAAWADERSRLLDALKHEYSRYGEAIADRDHERAARIQDAERHEREMVRAETRFADLMASYRMLRLQGASQPADTPRPPERKPDPVLDAVNAATAGKDAKTRAAMLRQVSIDRKADLSDVEIIARIHRGNRPAEDLT